jgi:SdrD B-like domain
VKKILALSATVAAVAFLVGSAQPSAAAGAAGGTASGVVFRDYDASGTRSASEVGVGGVKVTAVDGDGTTVGTATTAGDGTYSLAVAGAKSTSVRIEFTDLPAGAKSGPKGADSGTTVQFITVPATNVSLGVNDPADYCQADPEIVTSCFRTDAAGVSIVNIPSNAGTTSTTSNAGVTTPTTHSLAVPSASVGAVRGLAFNRAAGKIYSAAYAKSGTSYGPNGPGAIYVTDRATGATSVLGVTIAADNAIQHSATPVAVDPNAEIAAFWNAPGHEAWGDIDTDATDSRLFGSNLLDGKLYAIALDAAGNATGFSALAAPVTTCAAGNLVPGALKWSGTALLAAFTCTGPTDAALRGYVFSYANGGGTPTQVASVALNYTRGCGYAPTCSDGQWKAWVTTPTTLTAGLGTTLVSYPQPWISDIEITETGQMMLGINDRFGDQSLRAGARTLTGTSFKGGDGLSVGDLIRLVPTGATFALDPAYTTGGPSSSAAADPIGGERFPTTGGFHDEIATGALAYRLGGGQVLSTAIDPAPVNGALPNGNGALYSGGLLWLDSVSGARNQSYVLFDDSADTTFGKANGLGDLELLCDRAPIEIGNRVWFDANNNGQQDAGETPLGGVTVHIYDDNLLLGTTVTAADGSWYFNNGNVLGGVKPNHDYTVKLDNAADRGAGPLKDYVSTKATTGSTTTDSNAVDMGGSPAVMFTTGGPGTNDHTLDIGVFTPTVVLPTGRPAITIKKYVLKEGGNPLPETPANPDWLDAQTVADAAEYTKTSDIPFLVVATNTGDVDLLNAVIVSAESPSCNRSQADIPGLARMKPGAVVTYRCTAPDVSTSGNCSVTITATPVSGGPDLSANDPVNFVISVVLGGPPEIPPTGLPPTGSAVWPYTLAATWFVLVGLMFVVSNRRRVKPAI